MRLKAEAGRCTGCGICELWCAQRHEGERRLLRIRIREKESLVGRKIEVCRQCKAPKCIDSCPVEALSVDDKTGAIIVDRDTCAACGDCLDSCPHHAIKVVDNFAIVCDLCGGSPACVEACPEKVLTIK
jgi:carbon-monoxide dehydrogenase iron sulfur subunit